MSQFIIKPLYSIVELSKLFKKQYMATVTLLKNLDIPVHKIGNRCYVYLSDIKNKTPDLFVSLIETIDLLNNAQPVETEPPPAEPEEEQPEAENHYGSIRFGN